MVTSLQAVEVVPLGDVALFNSHGHMHGPSLAPANPVFIDIGAQAAQPLGPCACCAGHLCDDARLSLRS